MNLYWRRTRFTWIASKRPFQDINKHMIEGEVQPPSDVNTLTMKILKYGGESVCVKLPEPDMNLLLKKGDLIPFKWVKHEIGEDNSCHSNSSRLWFRQKRNFYICTGYGLTEDDQMWRQHTWLIDKQKETITETTEEREKYFGIIFRGVKAWHFAITNL